MKNMHFMYLSKKCFSTIIDELDSYMYQSVGHQAVELYAEAMGLPLFRQRTNGVALQQEKIYTHTPEDEVEDLFDLLANIKVFVYCIIII